MYFFVCVVFDVFVKCICSVMCILFDVLLLGMMLLGMWVLGIEDLSTDIPYR